MSRPLSNGFPQSAMDWDSSGITNIDKRNTACRKGQLHRVNVTLNITTGAVGHVSFTTGPKEVFVYSTLVVSSADKLTYEYLEGATVSGGTTLTPRRHNRVSSQVSEVVCKLNPTVSVQGQVISDSYLPGSTGVGQTRAGVSSGGGEVGWLLKPNTTYLIKLTNGSTETNKVHVTEIWIER